jgi:hypothetical protein
VSRALVEFEGSTAELDLTRAETDPVRDWAAKTSLGAAARLRDRGIIEPLPEATRQFAALLRNWPADVVVFDWLFLGAAVAAEAAGIPAIALGSSPWPPENSDPLILVSVSTSYMNQNALVQRVLDAVEGLKARVLFTAGPAIDVAQLRIPANTRAEVFVPHKAVLPNVALVITHAGWQTVNAALSCGVPPVCIPDGRDQPDNAARVVSIGAGVRLHKRASSSKIRRVVEEALLDPSLKRRAEVMATALSRKDGALTTAEALEVLVRANDMPASSQP